MAFFAVVVTAAAFVLPFTRSSINAMNLTGDARSLSSHVSLAKMRAAAYFTRARVRVNLAARTYQVEWFRRTSPAAWVMEGQTETLSPTVNFGFSNLTSPPPNTQGVLGQAPACLNQAGATIANTACIVFNSRGIPIDDSNAPTAGGAFYISDGLTVFGVTASSGGMVQLWRSNITGGAAWALN